MTGVPPVRGHPSSQSCQKGNAPRVARTNFPGKSPPTWPLTKPSSRLATPRYV